LLLWVVPAWEIVPTISAGAQVAHMLIIERALPQSPSTIGPIDVLVKVLLPSRYRRTRFHDRVA